MADDNKRTDVKSVLKNWIYATDSDQEITENHKAKKILHLRPVMDMLNTRVKQRIAELEKEKTNG